jgi:hypothetical protein
VTKTPLLTLNFSGRSSGGDISIPLVKYSSTDFLAYLTRKAPSSTVNSERLILLVPLDILM